MVESDYKNMLFEGLINGSDADLLLEGFRAQLSSKILKQKSTQLKCRGLVDFDYIQREHAAIQLHPICTHLNVVINQNNDLYIQTLSLTYQRALVLFIRRLLWLQL